jgi:glycosidase
MRGVLNQSLLWCLSLAATCLLTVVPHGALAADSVAHVPWSRQATIYEVNLRQYTPEGTINAFAAQLPRLKAMGVDILWLMPVHPIGVKHRKGTLGSYYAVRDYLAVNPEFGTQADLKRLVDEAHALGMKVILDWVANHTAWDNPWVTQHPGWYKKNAAGQIYPATFGEGDKKEEWTDVVALDYTQPALRQAMTEALLFWVREVGIDGYRCDVASLVPTSFWEEARAALDRVKPVFMLAESDAPDLHAKAFDMTYDWGLGNLMRRIAKGKATAADLARHLREPNKAYPADAYRMVFTSNHDWNSWDGSDTELYGPAFKAMAVLAATLPGMPLVYGGQEAGLDKRVAFFEKDPIAWNDRPLVDFYTGLFQLKHQHPVLANGSAGGALEIVETGHPAVFAFRRVKDGQRLTVVVNLSGQNQTLAHHATLGTRAFAPWSWQIDNHR